MVRLLLRGSSATGRVAQPWHVAGVATRPRHRASLLAMRIVRPLRRLAVPLPLPADGDKTLQVAGDLFQDRIPVAGTRLPIDAQCGIPRAVKPARQPAPAVIKPVKQPDRLAQRSCEMRDSGVYRDDQVEIGDQRRGVGEIVHLVHIVDEMEARGGRNAALLQTEEPHPGHIEQWRQSLWGEGAPTVDCREMRPLVVRTPRPHQANTRPPVAVSARRVRQTAAAAGSARR